MGAPPDLQALLERLRPFGVTTLTIQRGQFTLGTATPGVTGTVRLDFAVQPVLQFPGVTLRPEGTASVVYDFPVSGRVQTAVPLFADIPGFLSAAQAMPGVTRAQPQADGTVTALVDGQPVKVRPDFVVTRSPGASKRILAEGGTLLFDTGDGRRQRFTIVP